MKYREFKESLRSGKTAPFYLFSGQEEYLAQRSIDEIMQQVTGKEENSFNEDIFYASEVSGKKVVDSASTMPFLSEKRFIAVKDVQKWHARDWAVILDYLKDPNPQTCLVLWARQRIDTRVSPYNKVCSYGEHVVFWPLFEHEAKHWIRQNVKKRGKDISPDALEYLYEFVGENLFDLDSEIEKLDLYTDQERFIDLQDVQALLGHKNNNMFKLIDSLFDKDDSGTFRLLKGLLESGVRWTSITSFLGKSYRWMLQAKSDKKIASGYLKPYQRKLAGMLPGLSEKEIIASYRKILEIETRIKQGKLESDTGLEILLANLLSRS